MLTLGRTRKFIPPAPPSPVTLARLGVNGRFKSPTSRKICDEEG